MATRSPRPEDLYDLRVPTDLELSPDGRFVAFSVKAVAPGKDGYRSSLWLAPADGIAPARQLTVGSRRATRRRDGRPTDARSPSCRTAARCSRPVVAARSRARPEAPKEGGTQVWLLPFADGGEARQLTDLPKNVEGLDWSPDGRRLVVVSRADSTEPETQARAQARGSAGARHAAHRHAQLPVQRRRASSTSASRASGLVDATTGEAELLTTRQAPRRRPAVVARWPPDRLRLGPPPEPRPRLAQRHLPRRRARRSGFGSSRRVAAASSGALPSGRRTAGGSPPSAPATGSAASCRRHRSGASGCATATPRT